MTSGPRSLRCARARAPPATQQRLAAAARTASARELRPAGVTFACSLPHDLFARFLCAQLYGAIQSLSFNDLTGSALVEYSSIGEAVSANNALQGQAIAGQELKVAFETVGGPPQPPGRAGASASATGAPAVVGRPSFTCSTPRIPAWLARCLASALRFAIPLRRHMRDHILIRQPPTSMHCSIHNKSGSLDLQCLCWFPRCTPPTRTTFEASIHMPRQHLLSSMQQLMQGAQPPLLHQLTSQKTSPNPLSRGYSAAV